MKRLAARKKRAGSPRRRRQSAGVGADAVARLEQNAGCRRRRSRKRRGPPPAPGNAHSRTAARLRRARHCKAAPPARLIASRCHRRVVSTAMLSAIITAGHRRLRHHKSAANAAGCDQPGIATTAGSALVRASRTRRQVFPRATASACLKSVTRLKPRAPSTCAQGYVRSIAESSTEVREQRDPAACSRAW